MQPADAPSDKKSFESGQFNSLIGQLLTLVESWGLEPTQENAVKSLVKQEIWQLWKNGQSN